MIFEHVEGVSDRAPVFQDGGAGEGARVDELLDQLRRGAVIPAQFFPPLLRLFGEQGFELPGRQLPQIDNLHGTGTQPLARSVHNHFYHIIIQSGSRMYFGNIRRIGCPWRAGHLCYHSRAERNVPRPQRIGRLGGTSLHGHESERMDFLSELRHPTTWYSKLAIAILALVLFALLAAGAVSGYLVYRMISPARSHSEIDLQNFPGHPDKAYFHGERRGTARRLVFPRTEIRAHHYSVPGLRIQPRRTSHAGLGVAGPAIQRAGLRFFGVTDTAGGRSTLGFQEVSELRAAMNAVANRGDVDANRFGLWGVNLGAYVALAEATSDRRVRAIAAESPYGQPKDMVALQVSRSGLGSVPLVTRMSQMIFGWVNSKFRNVPPLNTQIGKLSGVAQLYLESPDDPALSASTSELFRISSPPHELVVLPHGNYGGMLDDEKRSYENRIVSFFLVNLPPAGESTSQN